MNMVESNAEFFEHFPPHCLLRRLSFFNPAARWAMQGGTGTRAGDPGNEDPIALWRNTHSAPISPR